MNTFQAGEILFFRRYFFTDVYAGESSAPHYALVILPSVLTEFKNSLYCAVITSNHPRKGEHFLKLLKSKYTFFECDSFACFERLDFNSVVDIGGGTQPRGKLDREDTRMSYKLLRAALYNPKSKIPDYLRAAIIREWKRLKSMT